MCRRFCDDLDLKEISMPRTFFWDEWTNTQDEKHILNLLEDDGEWWGWDTASSWQPKKGIHKLKPDVLDFQIFQGVQGLGSLSWIQKIQGQ